MQVKPLRAAVVGCRMGAAHAKAMAQLPDYEVVAVCDIDEERANQLAGELGTAVPFVSYAKMLQEAQPEVVAVATPTALHAEQTFMAIESGVKGICCEKPMATNLADAKRMVNLCKERGIPMIVNHQRRMGKEMVAARELIEQGAIGEVLFVRANCAGDFLTDGTHAVDSALWLLGDPEVEWVFGQVEVPEKPRWRYGIWWKIPQPLCSKPPTACALKSFAVRLGSVSGLIRTTKSSAQKVGFGGQAINRFQTCSSKTKKVGHGVRKL